ncbi:MAG: hypothetical protein V4735_00115 [Pseudomonadota bacterium]
MSGAAAAANGFKASMKSLWSSLGDVAGHAGSAASAAARNAKQGVQAGDAYVAAAIKNHDNSFGKAIVGIAKEKPVTAALAATGLAAGTVYAGSKVLGRHTNRVMSERQQSSERDR